MRPYFQTTSFTTAASSLLTILHFFKPEIKMTKEREFDIWRRTAILPTRSSSLYGLAKYAQEQGLLIRVIVENKLYSFPDYRFYRYKKKDIEEAAFSECLYLKEAELEDVEIIEKKICFSDIQEELQKENLLLLRVNAKQIRNLKINTSNYVVIWGFSEGYFHVFDPTFAGLSIPEEVMKEAFFSLETKKHRDHRMIVFERS